VVAVCCLGEVLAREISIERFQALYETSLSAEQIAAVTAPLDATPSLVVAAAGSGKTKVMALRAVWLVATAQLQPAEVIGLTFTRRAASELDKRLQQYLSILKATSTNPEHSNFWPGEIPNDAELPKVSTYNSFAVELFEQRAVALGFEPDAQTLGEADAFRLARRVALSPTQELVERLTESQLARDTLIDSILTLTHELADNNQSTDLALSYLAEFRRRLEAAPLVGKEGGRHKYFEKLLQRVSEKILIADLAVEYQKLKTDQGVLEYSDQVVLALRGAEFAPFNLGFRAVLLDEYQDTSPIQAQLLAMVFRNSSIMAVGDPRQAIYGWRGASAANLSDFFRDFRGDSNSSGRLFSLSTNWRSNEAIVSAANVTANRIDSTIRDSAGKNLASENSQLLPAPGAANGKVWISISQDQDTEATLVAEWFRERLQNEPDATAAILFRSRRHMSTFAEALHRCGVKYSLHGLGGMLEIPEVADLVSALRVIFEIDSGIYLMRLLAGPRWRVGAGDIAALSNYAKAQTRFLEEFDDGPELSLTEALDEMLIVKSVPSGMSEAGFVRIQEAASMFRKMRGFFGLGLSETARLIVEELQLDIEIVAATLETSADPLRNLNAFYQVLDDYENRAARPSMPDFLEWLNFATQHERFEPPSGSEPKGLVQLLTVHAAKGLEWNYVAMPNLVKDQFPAKAQDNSGWLGYGKLPFELRQDSIGLPTWTFPGDASQSQINESLEEFKGAMSDHRLAEERRVAYVAVTRAESELLVSASYWRRGLKKPDSLSEFLVEQLEGGHATPLGSLAESPEESNPLDSSVMSAAWPSVSSPERLNALSRARALVEEANPASASGGLAQLLAERRLRLEALPPLLPRRLSASALVSLIANPVEFSLRLARPEPSLFSASAKLGSEVHSALETAFGGEDVLDYLSGLAADAEESQRHSEAELLRTYLESAHGKGTPELVEHEVEFVLGPIVVTCKLDAVFKNEFGYEIIDWKTGSPPKTELELEQRSLQLAIYRVALSELLLEPIERISAGFFFLSTGEQVTPRRLDGKEQLELRLNQALRQLEAT